MIGEWRFHFVTKSVGGNFVVVSMSSEVQRVRSHLYFSK